MATCIGCCRPILDRYVLEATPGLLQWHASCLRCAECGHLIDESSRTCFIRHHSIYCSDDFHRSVSVGLNRSILFDYFPVQFVINSGKEVQSCAFRLFCICLCSLLTLLTECNNPGFRSPRSSILMHEYRIWSQRKICQTLRDGQVREHCWLLQRRGIVGSWLT